MSQHQEHPEVDRREIFYKTWPADKPFPITPLEAWYILQGWAVRPANLQAFEQEFDNLPSARFEMLDWYLMLRQR